MRRAFASAALGSALLSFAGCSDQPSESRMRSWVEQQWGLPKCKGSTYTFVERDPGGGWQGGWNTFVVEADNACWEAWHQSIMSRGGQCKSRRCDISTGEEGLGVEQETQTRLRVTKWSNT